MRTLAYIIEVKVKKKAVGSVSGPTSQLRVILTKVWKMEKRIRAMEHAVTFVTVRCDARFITETIREIIESTFDTCKEKKGKRLEEHVSG